MHQQDWSGFLLHRYGHVKSKNYNLLNNTHPIVITPIQKTIMETTKNSFTPKELVYKHIYDPNHVVTEEELRNMIIGVSEMQTSYDGIAGSKEQVVKEKEGYLIQ